jgi:Leucine Rich repeat
MPTNGESETLILPEGHSVGRITVYHEGQREPSDFLDARGTVQVPKNSKLFLDLSQDVCDDLRKVHSIPDSLLVNGISISERRLARTDFRELFSLHVHSLAITFCDGLRPEQLQQIGKLNSLEHLNLEKTPFEPSDFSWVLEFSNLRTLLLSGTGANGTCIPFLAGLHRLEDLHLADCKISDQDAHAIWQFAGLKAVNLGMCPITDRALEGVGRSSVLISLSVPDTGISDEGVEILVAEALRTGQKLSSLTLRSCRITDEALVRLASLKSLTFIDLYSTEVTPEGASFLKKSLPDCRIFVGRDKGGGPRLWKVECT